MAKRNNASLPKGKRATVKTTKSSLVKSLVANAKKALTAYRSKLTDHKAINAHNAINALSSMPLSKADSKKLHALQARLAVADNARNSAEFLKKSTMTDLIKGVRPPVVNTHASRYVTKRAAINSIRKRYTALMVEEYGKGWKSLIPDDTANTKDAGKTFAAIFEEMMELVTRYTKQGGLEDSQNKALYKLRFIYSNPAEDRDRQRFFNLLQFLSIPSSERYPDSPTRG